MRDSSKLQKIIKGVQTDRIRPIKKTSEGNYKKFLSAKFQGHPRSRVTPIGPPLFDQWAKFWPLGGTFLIIFLQF